ncbi:hypothetical protein THIX_60470 [Thiomonas sp. X19]|uniref:hypothetical protein n=1 Tax=Thiomonas sp. X19 TaxID=1050370 RepID=UPI000B642363|nr:hypothetical protein [Thiomonas sp. X19]SCC94412.1 hypothetical protein THIX_60470 [Thiomonas sp. X19]
MELPKIYPLAEVCQKFLPQGRDTIKNRARRQPDGSYLSTLGGGQALRLVKLGARFAVTETDLIEFLLSAGVRIEAPAPAADATPQRRRAGRPRKATLVQGKGSAA